jgi:hypothetical protein
LEHSLPISFLDPYGSLDHYEGVGEEGESSAWFEQEYPNIELDALGDGWSSQPKDGYQFDNSNGVVSNFDQFSIPMEQLPSQEDTLASWLDLESGTQLGLDSADAPLGGLGTNMIHTTESTGQNLTLAPSALLGQNLDDLEWRQCGPSQMSASSDLSVTIPSSEQQLLTCNDCNRFFPKLKQLQYVSQSSFSMVLPLTHGRQHRRCHNKCHACNEPGCNSQFATKRDLKRHHQLKHQNLSLPCPYCKKRIKRWDNLTRHALKVHGQTLLMRDFDALTKGLGTTIGCDMGQELSLHGTK